ncbi:hypothetical protein [Paenibacillus etheri]|nr:hypothetical protein [Paenibacillus etheri]
MTLRLHSKRNRLITILIRSDCGKYAADWRDECAGSTSRRTTSDP